MSSLLQELSNPLSLFHFIAALVIVAIACVYLLVGGRRGGTR